MEIEKYPLLFNIIIAFILLVPLIVCMFFIKVHATNSTHLLLGGLFLILYSCLAFGCLSEAIRGLESIDTNKGLNESILSEIITNVQIWIFIIPGVSAAIGANLITEYMLKSDES